MVSSASSSAFIAEMLKRYSDLLKQQDSRKLQNKIFKLEKKLAVAESETRQLQAERDRMAIEKEEDRATINSLQSAL